MVPSRFNVEKPPVAEQSKAASMAQPSQQTSGPQSSLPRQRSMIPVAGAGASSFSRRQSTILRDARDKLLSFVSTSRISADRDGFKDGVYLNGVLNPYSKFVQRWNKIFFLSMLIAFGVDPLFFYTLVVDSTKICTFVHFPLALVLTIIRSVCDFLYAIHIALQFRIAFVSTETRSVGRGELIISKKLIARNYMRGPFLGDLIAVLPLPQLVIWCVIPHFLKTGDTANMAKDLVLIIALVQYVPRVVWIFYHYKRMKRATGIVFETAWSGFALNVLVYILLSHILGACWYLFGLQRVDHCMRQACQADSPNCSTHYLHCSAHGLDGVERSSWLASANASNIPQRCFAPLTSASFNYGIYANAVDIVTVTKVSQKVLFSFFWGLQALSTTADNLTPSKFEGEIIFAVLIILAGLLLFSLLVGNMQTFLQSLGKRMEDYRSMRRDMEEWMVHRRLPEDLRKQVTEYQRHHWAATRGVDEDQMLESLPADLRSGIKFHMCMNLICSVPIFLDLDVRVKQALCDLLHQQLFIKGSCVMREGDPVTHMLFIIRGEMVRFRTEDGSEKGHVDLKGKGFCGAELLLFLLEDEASEDLIQDLESGLHYPVALSTVRCTKAVDAFSISARDLANVIRRYRLREDGKLLAAVKHQRRLEWEAAAKAEAMEREKHKVKASSNSEVVPVQNDTVAIEIEEPSGQSSFRL